jgi:3-dehydroquinate dehydratase-2
MSAMPEPLALHVLNGPNLNLLGEREPDIYGRETLTDIQALCEAAAGDVPVVFRQSNHEGQLVEWIHEARGTARALVINPAAFTHTSIALLDALKTLDIPVVECHLSNPAAREEFRRIISGFGPHGYELAVKAALRLAQERADATVR